MTKIELLRIRNRAEAVENEIMTLASSSTAMLHMQKIQALGVEYRSLNATIRETLDLTLLKGVIDDEQ